MKKKPLDAALEEIEKNREFAKIHLDKQAIIVRAIDRKLEALEEQKKRLEKEKQKECGMILINHKLVNNF